MVILPDFFRFSWNILHCLNVGKYTIHTWSIWARAEKISTTKPTQLCHDGGRANILGVFRVGRSKP